MKALTRTIARNRNFPQSWSSAVDSVCAACFALGDSGSASERFFMSNAEEFMGLLRGHLLNPQVERDFKAIWSCLEGPPAIEAAIMSVALVVHRSL